MECYEKPGLSPGLPEAEGMAGGEKGGPRMEADHDLTPHQALHKASEDRILVSAHKNRPPKAVTSSSSSSSSLSGEGPTSPVVGVVAQLTSLTGVLSWESENSWSLCAVMGRWPEAGSFIWGLRPLLWA